MSVQLLKTDNISIIGEYQEKQFDKIGNGEKTDTPKQKYIHLFFTIQINGKIKTLNHYIKLMDINEGLTLENFEGWYMLHNSLEELGYPIGEKDDPLSGNTIIKWIDTVYQASQENDTFHF